MIRNVAHPGQGYGRDNSGLIATPKLHHASVNTAFNNIVTQEYSAKAKQFWGFEYHYIVVA
jgi:hypothetical protein